MPYNDPDSLYREQRSSSQPRQAQRASVSRLDDASRYSDRSRYTSQRRQSSPQGQAPRQRQARDARSETQTRAAGGRAASQGYRSATQYQDASRYSRNAAGYNSLYDQRFGAAPAKRGNGTKIALAIAVAAIIAILLWVFAIPKPFEVTVNGKEVTMGPGSTMATLVEEGHARPSPGNLVAVDGSTITVGKGEPFSATVDGKPVAVDAKLAAGMNVEIGNGGDITEDYTSTETVVPFGTINDDSSFEAYWNASIHLLQDGKDGLAIEKTGSISGKTVQEVTQAPIDGGYHAYTAAPPDKVIALTFDDGPWPDTTHQILDILEENGAKATFFTIGNQISSQPDAVQRASNMGCEICTHTWDHADGAGQGVDLTLMSSQEQIDEVTQGYAAIASAIGHEPAHILRAPGGNFHDDIIQTLWPYLDAEIGWDVDTEDWSLPGAEAIASRILSVEPGQVILMHDGGGDRAQTVAALRQALPTLVERGYKFVTISELLAYGEPERSAAPDAGGERNVEGPDESGASEEFDYYDYSYDYDYDYDYDYSYDYDYESESY